MTTHETLDILGYKVFSGSKELLANVSQGVINTINPHSFVLARKDAYFTKSLLSSSYLLPDGVGIKYAARLLLGKKILKIAGSDLHEIILKSIGKKGGSCFYLGSTPKTLLKLRERLAVEHPTIKSGTFSPPFKAIFSDEENSTMISAVNSFSPDVLFVGMTAPKQEKWVYENKGKIKAPLICCIGAAFDFYAGTVKRPRQLWIDLGLEWLPRLVHEPRRLWKRNIISTPLFLWYMFLGRINRL